MPEQSVLGRPDTTVTEAANGTDDAVTTSKHSRFLMLLLFSDAVNKYKNPHMHHDARFHIVTSLDFAPLTASYSLGGAMIYAHLLLVITGRNSDCWKTGICRRSRDGRA